MRKGAFVLIFLVWAFITIITPILVQWSHPHQATIKPLFQVNASDEGLLKHRKMLVLIDDTNYRNVTTSFQRHMPTITIAIPPAPSPQQNRIGSS
ncbi:unnamed protein product [Amaranthus hypochondriacus]